MKKRKILFLGESYRADAITWINGLREYGDFEIICWELKTPSTTLLNRILRIAEFNLAYFKIKKIIKDEKPDMVIAERTTSYGFLAGISGIQPSAIAQQGITDLWPTDSILLSLKILIQNYAFSKATLIHAWGPAMTISMAKAKVDMNKVMVLPKGINLEKFSAGNAALPTKIHAIVTRSLLPEYSHDIILKAFEIVNQSGIDFVLTIIGDGRKFPCINALTKKLKIADKVVFTGRISNTELPELLKKSNFYISMPTTEGVSASLFEAMACQAYPIVTDIVGNQSWIKHRANGQLVAVNDYKMLAEEIIWAFNNIKYRENAIHHNRLLVESKANYQTNMKAIAQKYHELITAHSLNK
ncbi:glycosyltransferase [Flavobacterium sp.]|uniref:glycosyltransferase n=1 Tax=Flavobacterium sp. TaxID=239 RepID=UPI00261E1EDB|nr:glycosyltransferase [Flavobacterium sp.]MDG2431267.1 glycosyltransferase [Flavobacterium sp.]